MQELFQLCLEQTLTINDGDITVRDLINDSSMDCLLHNSKYKGSDSSFLVATGATFRNLS